MDRLEHLRQVVDAIIRRNPDPEEARCGFVHLYGVSAVCMILAMKRGLDGELCAAAGTLHDIWNYQVGECSEHGPLSAIEAEKILRSLGSFSAAEIDVISAAIARHSDKEAIDSEMAELLKDADVFQHYLYNPRIFTSASQAGGPVKPARVRRLERVLAELGLP